ncbi:LIM domain-containing protein HDR3-like isoform X4 [Musa acuminata AAA Group]|uniref:LIM zinc-binding domain-containing protein n=1 Tax=Musa acuminata subsp. malaccensis TaxID=214687 RepID=A0A804KRQ8_MUSAM|nr:PREDICTED: protein DA1-related 2-like isoform X4 [Musa acuminata subsp. malaccensis]
MDSSDSSYVSRPRAYGHTAPSYPWRRSRFMRWLCKFFKGTGCRVSNGRHSHLIGGESMLHRPVKPADDQSKDANEDLDHANALSLVEDAKKPNAPGYRGQGIDDDELAKAIQESLSMPSYQPYQPVQFLPRGYRICGGCHHEIGYGHYLSCMGTFWHPQCFRCYACGQLIRETEFSLSGTYPYHKSCYKELHHPKCDVCHEFSRNTRYIYLGEGRSLCLECLESAIMDAGDCQPLYHSIRDYYEGMNMRIDQQIPMLLVERQALNEAMEGEKYGHHHMPETRGLCLSEEQTVSSIHKRPRIGGNKILDMRTHPQKLIRRCEVTAILVLYGLPRLLTGSILAHELMHGWLRLKGYRDLSPEVEEGICQVLSHMWLESEIMPGSTSVPSSSSYAPSSSSAMPSSKKAAKSDTEKKLGEFFMHQIAHDTSTAYGEGFRAANAAVNKYGLRRTLDHIHFTGAFPV